MCVRVSEERSAMHERKTESSGVQATKSLMNGNMCSLIDQFSHPSIYAVVWMNISYGLVKGVRGSLPFSLDSLLSAGSSVFIRC